MGDEQGHERIVDILVPLENMPVNPGQVLHRMSVGINVDRSLHHRVKTTHIVESESVIDVIVGVDDPVTACQLVSQHLLAEIGGSVNQDHPLLPGCIDKTQARRSAGSIVPGVGTPADLAVTADHRHPGRGAGAEDDELEIGNAGRHEEITTESGSHGEKKYR